MEENNIRVNPCPLEYFGKRAELDAVLLKMRDKAAFAKRFNGTKVSEMTGLTGRPLGDLMKKLNAEMPEDLPSRTDDELKYFVSEFTQIV